MRKRTLHSSHVIAHWILEVCLLFKCHGVKCIRRHLLLHCLQFTRLSHLWQTVQIHLWFLGVWDLPPLEYCGLFLGEDICNIWNKCPERVCLPEWQPLGEEKSSSSSVFSLYKSRTVNIEAWQHLGLNNLGCELVNNVYNMESVCWWEEGTMRAAWWCFYVFLCFKLEWKEKRFTDWSCVDFFYLN